MKKMIITKRLIFVLLVLLSFSFFYAKAQFGTSGTVNNSYYGGDSEISKPELRIISGENDVDFISGEATEIRLKIKNSSDYDASNIKVIFKFDDPNCPVKPKKLNDTCYIDSIDSGDKENVSIPVIVNDIAQDGTYPIKIEIKYFNSDGQEFSNIDNIYVKVKAKGSPKLILDANGAYPPSINAGDEFPLKLKVNNSGDQKAENVKVTVSGFKEGISLKSSQGTQYFYDVDPKESVYTSFRISIAKNAVDASFPLDINLEYDFQGKTHTEKQQIFINVKGKLENADGLSVGNINVSSDTIDSRQDFDINFDIKANQGKELRNIKVSLQHDKELYENSQGTLFFDSLSNGDSKNCIFTLFADKEAESKNYTIGVVVEYEEKDINGLKYDKKTTNRYCSISLNNTQKKDDSKVSPKVILERYSLEPKEIKSGDTFTMKMYFWNTNMGNSVENVRLKVFSEDGAIDVTDDQNGSIFFGTIAPNGKFEKEIKLSTYSDLPSKLYYLTVSVDYEDSDGKSFSDKDRVGVRISQPVSIETGSVSIPENIKAGKSFPVSLEIFNIGKTQISNAKIIVDGNFKVADPVSHIGIIETGKKEYFETDLTVQEPGNYKGKIIFEYIDSLGKKCSVEKEIIFTAHEDDLKVKQAQQELMNKKGTNNSGVGIGITIVIILVIIVVGFIAIKKVLKKRGNVDELGD